jgi:uncharacterized protein YhaN
MKLSQLFLQAFGPFTDTTLDFSASTANLHVIYGPNEAGKSSALRAMTDLRFGIPPRSPDNFIHPFNQMQIAGLFCDEQGETLGFLRRKGNKATLFRLDPISLQADTKLPVQTAHELALTGGLERNEFEAMFGLNHQRLREGGDLLLKGEGELGAALFEASAGTRGIAAILQELETDAKKLYNRHGMAKSVINEAKRQLDEQRQLLRHAQTKPADWHGLYRAHAQAKTALDEIEQALEQQRRLAHELSELRAVEPLLREHERIESEWQALAHIPDLPETAEKERLLAEQALHNAAQQALEAEEDIKRCHEALAELQLEPVLLEHAETIERLAAHLEALARSRIEVRQQQTAIEQMQVTLTEAAIRIGHRADESLTQALPTAAGRAELNHHLETVAKLSERLAGYQQQTRKLAQALKQYHEDPITPPSPGSRRALALALRQAQVWGDVERQTADWQRQVRDLEQQLKQALAGLGLSSVAALSDMRLLLEAEIHAVQVEFDDIEQNLRTLADEDGRLQRDLEEQRLRLRQLQAEGEVVTAETLRQVRMQRDDRWQHVRRVYVERTVVGHNERVWADNFESAQTEADRQADLLRADVKRATSYEECATRIEQMERRSIDIKNERKTLNDRKMALHSAWAERLAQVGLPQLPVAALSEWQDRRQNTLLLAERLSSTQSDYERWLAETSLAAFHLDAALQNIGFPVNANRPPVSTLIEQAQAWDKAATETQTKYEERAKAMTALTQEQEELNQQLVDTTALLTQHQTRLSVWLERLGLAADSPPEAVQARLAELDQLAQQTNTLADLRLRLAQSQAVIDEFNAQAQQLAERLNETAADPLDSFIERLRKRLQASKEADQQRKTLERDLKKAEKNRQKALNEHSRQAEILTRLCAAAGVGQHQQLPAQEQLAAQKRQAHDALERLRQQLRAASTRSEAELRQLLADRDTISLDAEREHCQVEIARLEHEQQQVRQREEQSRHSLEAIDASDQAARAREAMEAAAARYRAALQPWARLKLAHALLGEALNRFRERAQAPMVTAASAYFKLMTGGRYQRLLTDELDGKPVLRALRDDGATISVEAMSEGTADQLYLALRLAALELRRTSHPAMPLVLDDVLITSDDHRAANILQALARFAEQGQVMLFTHHRHLLDLTSNILSQQAVAIHQL